MAFIQIDFKSEALALSTSVNVLLPHSSVLNSHRYGECPVLYLLHGLSDDQSVWMRRTSIERYAEAYNLAVIMPAVNRSFYANMYCGHRYWDFISSELPELCQCYLPISRSRDQTFAAGLSMGGYGAFKLALSLPHRYSAAASLSGVLDLNFMREEREERLPDWSAIFGEVDTIEGSEHDLLHLASSLVDSSLTPPALYQCCGTEDFLYESNLSFRSHCEALGLELTYEEQAGDHEWGYWDNKIQRVLEWLPLERIEAE